MTETSIDPGVTPLPEGANKGSQRWLQLAVEKAPEVINRHIREAMKLGGDSSVEWLSPLRADRYVEYRDETFVVKLGLDLKTPLSSFWPSRGPMWDGLASAGDARILVEAKAHVGEMISGSTRASGKSKKTIEAALAAVRKALAPRSEVDWSHWNGAFYQYANRLAHLHFLHENAGKNVHLLYIYFINARDVKGPESVDEWRGAIKLMEGYLGVGVHRLQKFVHKIFPDVTEICRESGTPLPT